MKIYTKKGDQGFTGLLGGARRIKSDMRVEAYGTVDELNCYVGMLRDQEVNKSKLLQLGNVQNLLFTIGSHLANDENSKFELPALNPAVVNEMEVWIDEMDAALPEMKFFILPGGHQSVSFAHMARAVCRRAERSVIRLSEEEKVDTLIIQYLNRLSDYLFILSRWMALELNVEEIKWVSDPR